MKTITDFLRPAYVATAVACLALSPTVQAVSPDPGGGYANNNTAEGTKSLFSLTSGNNNTANGYQALYTDTAGVRNTAVGSLTLYSNTVGYDNAANGYQALYSNTIGKYNSAAGSGALYSNATGNENTATGGAALYYNTTGEENTADGVDALHNNTTASKNTALGYNALANNTTGNNNIALGYNAAANLTTGNYNIDIGSAGIAGESNYIRIGNVGTQTAAFVAGINGAAVTGTAVVVSNKGQLGVAPSSERFKKAIRPMDKASEAILALKPVTFYYKPELDPDGIPEFGLIAEDVEKVNPDLVTHDANGTVYTVRYDAVNAMLLNEFLKEHQKVEKLEAALAVLNERLKQHDAKIDKIRAEVVLTKPAPQVASRNQ